MNNTEIILLSCLCGSVFLNLFFLIFYVLKKSNYRPGVVHNHYHQASIPVPRYVQAEEGLPETRQGNTSYGDQELRDTYR